MPEVRYAETFDGKGKRVEKIKYTVSDEQLRREGLERKAGEVLESLRSAWDNWSGLATAQKDETIKELLWYALYMGGKL